ncbi:MAG: glycine cleavage system protein GcvH [Gemmatimonadales bacterium]
MSQVPDDLRYTSEHEYVRVSDDPMVVDIGITDYAQGELGDVVFVNLPKVGEKFASHQAFGTIEAVKAVSDLYCPVAGEIVAVNESLEADPALVNREPYGGGWMIRLRVASRGELGTLLDASDYRAHIGA